MSASDVHKRLVAIRGEPAPCRRSVFRWVSEFKDGRDHAGKRKSTGRPANARRPHNTQLVNGMILENRRITFDELVQATGLSRGTLHTIIHEDLKMKKVCAQWVPHNLTNAQKQKRVEICQQLVQQYSADPEEFFAKLVTVDESWFFHETPEKKRQSMEWKHTGSPRPKKSQPGLFVRKQMATVFWDQEGILMVDWLPPNSTINSDQYCNSLQQLRRRIQQRRRGKWGRGVLLQQDNARPHVSHQTIATIRKLGLTVLPHPPYSPDLAPSDYALFDSMKEVMRGKKFTTNEELHAAVHQWRRDTPKEWYTMQIWKLPERWNKCIGIGGEYL